MSEQRRQTAIEYQRRLEIYLLTGILVVMLVVGAVLSIRSPTPRNVGVGAIAIAGLTLLHVGRRLSMRALGALAIVLAGAALFVLGPLLPPAEAYLVNGGAVAMGALGVGLVFGSPKTGEPLPLFENVTAVIAGVLLSFIATAFVIDGFPALWSPINLVAIEAAAVCVDFAGTRWRQVLLALSLITAIMAILATVGAHPIGG